MFQIHLVSIVIIYRNGVEMTSNGFNLVSYIVSDDSKRSKEIVKTIGEYVHVHRSTVNMTKSREQKWEIKHTAKVTYVATLACEGFFFKQSKNFPLNIANFTTIDITFEGF